MDRQLRRLKRSAEIDPMTQAQALYIAALERVVGDLSPVSHPELEDANIAQCFTGFDSSDSEAVDAAEIRTEAMQGLLVEVYWENNYDSEHRQDVIDDITDSLSDEFKQLLADAANLGYSLIIFWK